MRENLPSNSVAKREVRDEMCETDGEEDRARDLQQAIPRRWNRERGKKQSNADQSRPPGGEDQPEQDVLLNEAQDICLTKSVFGHSYREARLYQLKLQDDWLSLTATPIKSPPKTLARLTASGLRNRRLAWRPFSIARIRVRPLLWLSTWLSSTPNWRWMDGS